MRYNAFVTGPGVEPPPLVVVDIGYAEEIASCGLWWEKLMERQGRQFYRVVAATTEALNHYLALDARPLLVVEAPLSRAHKTNGNPTCRGHFEEGRNWYRQSAAGVAWGAFRLLEAMAPKLTGDVWIAEAFLSNKDGERTAHWRDAERIFSGFWNSRPEKITAATVDALSPLIVGIPEVRVFAAADSANAA
jgi:hypothetical protein